MQRGTTGLLPPLRDMQDAPPLGYCRSCQAELYESDDEEYCPECLEDKQWT